VYAHAHKAIEPVTPSNHLYMLQMSTKLTAISMKILTVIAAQANAATSKALVLAAMAQQGQCCSF